MSELSDDRQFVAMCIAMAKNLSRHLKKGEEAASKAMIAGQAPRYVDGKQVHPESYVAGAMLLTVCGMAAENAEGESALLQAAELLQPLSISKDAELSEHIRSTLDEVLQVLGVRKTRHLWN